MTPEQERALLAATAAGLDEQVRAAYDDLIGLIREGVEPAAAVKQVMESFSADMATIVAAALTAIMAEAVDAQTVLSTQVGTVSLSGRLWREAADTGTVVKNLVDRQLAGFTDSRALALQLFEGYEFRNPADEPLKITSTNKQLPKYMREALLSDPGLERDLARNFAKIQVNGLSTPALQAAYSQLLESLDDMESTKGRLVLEKRIEVAFYERVRYFSQRIAQTELHRAYAKSRAAALMADNDVQFVQIKRAPGKQLPCICVLFTGRDLYGLGAGVYPKPKAPLPPYHPYCRCIVMPRLDLTGRAVAKPADPDADSYFLRNLGIKTGARVIGSRAKLDQVLTTNRSADEVYAVGKKIQIQTVAEGARL